MPILGKINSVYTFNLVEPFLRGVILIVLG